MVYSNLYHLCMNAVLKHCFLLFKHELLKFVNEILNWSKTSSFQERLMLSIIPEHIVSRVRQDIRAMFVGIQSHTLSYAMRSFK